MEIEFAGLILSEPVTAFGNLVLASVCYYAYRQVKRVANMPGKESWGYFFLTLGSATFIGIFTHLFSHYNPHGLRLVGWALSGLTAYFAQAASIEQLTRRKTGPLMLISKIEFVLFLIGLYWFQVFGVVLVVTVISLLTVLGIQTYGYFSRVLKGSEIILAGFVISALTAFARLLNLSLHPIWFNHHDVAHLMMIFAVLTIMVGVKRAAEAVE
ncbi:MAG: hypothetical protein AAGA85_08025 [Bacteroidota bacterium]